VHARNYLDYTRLQLSIANSDASIMLFMFLSADRASGLECKTNNKLEVDLTAKLT
jgi:hypothetical protein